tara:strand:- start:4145 stop:5341 length:1197 start_codon:yes stop_codon:yes gene_type:complete
MTGRLWFMFACGFVVVLIGNGLRQIFGVFQIDVTQELAIGFGSFGLVIGIQALILGIAQPASGLLADKYGSVRVIVGGALIYALGLWWASLSTSSWELAISLGVIVGLGLTGPTQVLVLGAIGKVVPDNRRSFVFGSIIASTSLGGALLIPIVFQLIQSFDWRTAFAIAALVIALLPIISLGLYNKNKLVGKRSNQSIREAITEAKSHPGFIFLTLGFFVCGFHVTFIGTHLPAFLIDGGLSPKFAADALSIVLFCNVIGAFLFGTLGDYFSKKNLLTLLYAARAALMIAMLLAPVDEVITIFFCVTMGFLWLSTVPLTSGLVAQIFGTQYFSMLFGIVFMSHQIGGFFGAWLAGYIFDTTGSYNLMWAAAACLGIASALLHWPIREQPLERLTAQTG